MWSEIREALEACIKTIWHYKIDLCLILSILHIISGHGGSDGLHAYVNSLDDAVNDTVLYTKYLLSLANEYKTQHIFMISPSSVVNRNCISARF